MSAWSPPSSAPARAAPACAAVTPGTTWTGTAAYAGSVSAASLESEPESELESELESGLESGLESEPESEAESEPLSMLSPMTFEPSLAESLSPAAVLRRDVGPELPSESEDLARLLPGDVPHRTIRSGAGHDGFLIEHEQIGELVRAAFLS